MRGRPEAVAGRVVRRTDPFFRSRLALRSLAEKASFFFSSAGAFSSIGALVGTSPARISLWRSSLSCSSRSARSSSQAVPG